MDAKKEKFFENWMKKDMSAIRDATVKDRMWKDFANEDCYMYQKWDLEICLLDFCDAVQIENPHINIDALLGPRDRD